MLEDEARRVARTVHAAIVAALLTAAPALVVVDVLLLWHFAHLSGARSLAGVAVFAWLLLVHARRVGQLWPAALLAGRARAIMAATESEMTMDDALRLAFEEREGAHEDDEEGDDQ